MQPQSQIETIHRHPPAVRVWHWLTAATVIGLLFTGFCIFNIHPRLYWGEVGNAATPPVFAIDSGDGTSNPPAARPSPAVLKVGSRVWDVTGYVGSVLDAGGDGKYFLIVMTPESWQFGAMRAWHFAFAWVLALGWIFYGAYLFIGRRFTDMLVPTIAQIRPRAVMQDLWHHLRLRRYGGEAARRYNLLQKLSYLTVLFVLIPVLILSGVTMSNAITARFPELFSLWGGRQSARTVHAICAAALFLFILMHIGQLFVGGFLNEIRSMITGNFAIRREGSK